MFKRPTLTPPARVQVTELNENSAKVIRGLVPTTIEQGQWTIEVVTRYIGASSDLLKEPRTIALANRLVCLGNTQTENVPQDPPSDT